MMSDSIDKFGQALHAKVTHEHKQTIRKEIQVLFEQIKRVRSEKLNSLTNEIQSISNLVNNVKKELETHLHNNVDFEKVQNTVRDEQRKELFHLAKVFRWYRFNTIVSSLDNERYIFALDLNDQTISWVDLFPEYKIAVSQLKKQ